MKWEALINEAKSIYPGLKVKYKNEHWYWRILPLAARRAVSAFLKTIWLPTREWAKEHRDLDVGETILHELRHIDDQYDDPLYLIKYTFPQCLSLLLVVFGVFAAVFHSWWLLAVGVLCGLFALPFPSPVRARKEESGYSINRWVQLECRQPMQYHEALRRWRSFEEGIVSKYTGKLYYRMTWRRDTALRYAIAMDDRASAYYLCKDVPYLSEKMNILARRWVHEAKKRSFQNDQK